MHRVSFGNMLKEARIARGMDVAAVSKELRIREDIIRAIEASDFSRMPPRGYARNMIAAYAKLLGLDTQSIVRMYLDEEYTYQVSDTHQSLSQSNTLRHESARSSTRSMRGQYGQGQLSSEEAQAAAEATQAARGRRSASRTRATNARGNTSGGRSTSFSRMPTTTTAQPHAARSSSMSQQHYGNLVAAPSNLPRTGSIPRWFLIAIIAVIVVLIIVIAVVNVSCSANNTEEETIPVTGVDEATDESEEEEEVTEPTEFTLTYTVDEGYESYIEIYIDDEIQESSTVTGSATNSYTISEGEIRFVSTQIDGVSLTVADEDITLESNSSYGVDNTYTFDDLLAAWQEANGTSSTSDSSDDEEEEDSSSSE